MEELIHYLERKNLCFRSFFQICNDFYDEIAAGKIENLGTFQARREGLLSVLEQLEVKIQEKLKENQNINFNETNKVKMEYLVNEKDGLLKQILDLDQKILHHINRLKDDTLQKLQSVQMGKKTIGAYRSPAEKVNQIEGEKRVDQEA
jgi:hypothetical protein